jgi:hypothetical protein
MKKNSPSTRGIFVRGARCPAGHLAERELATTGREYPLGPGYRPRPLDPIRVDRRARDAGERLTSFDRRLPPASRREVLAAPAGVTRRCRALVAVAGDDRRMRLAAMAGETDARACLLDPAAELRAARPGRRRGAARSGERCDLARAAMRWRQVAAEASERLPFAPGVLRLRERSGAWCRFRLNTGPPVPVEN